MASDMHIFKLKGASGKVAGLSFGLGARTLIGRADACDLRVDDEKVAPQHAEIVLKNGDGLHFRHLAEGYESRINGEIVGEAVREVALASGDEIRLGNCRWVVQAPGLRPEKVLTTKAVKAGPGALPWLLASPREPSCAKTTSCGRITGRMASRTGTALFGGNLPAGFSKELVAQGQAAMALSMARSYEQSALSDTARAQLEQDLFDGHCGKLPEKYLAPMKLVQRATDISMATALLAHRPAVLVAGNGHVRRDYGVPQVLSALEPSLKISSIGFYENVTDRDELIKSLAGRYDFVWLTGKADRGDPCEDFKLK